MMFNSSQLFTFMFKVINQNINMSFIPIVLILLFLHSTSGLIQIINIQHTACSFTFQHLQEEVQNYVFKQCTINNQNYRTSSGWENCISECCDQSVTYNQTFDSLSKCQQYANMQYYQQIISLTSIALIILFGTHIIYKQNWKSKKYVHPNLVQLIDRDGQEGGDKNYVQDIFPDNFEPQLQLHWIYARSGQKPKQNCQNCMNNIAQVYLKCRHFFDLHCFQQRMTQDDEFQCPVCNKVYNNVQAKLYCNLCFKAHAWTKIQNLSKKLDINNQICSKCKIIQQSQFIKQIIPDQQQLQINILKKHPSLNYEELRTILEPGMKNQQKRQQIQQLRALQESQFTQQTLKKWDNK